MSKMPFITLFSNPQKQKPPGKMPGVVIIPAYQHFPLLPNTSPIFTVAILHRLVWKNISFKLSMRRSFLLPQLPHQSEVKSVYIQTKLPLLSSN